MKITAVETFVISNRQALVKLSTDEGAYGWGECTLENWVRTVVAAVERMTEHLIGADPGPITALWQTLSRGGFYRGGPVLSSAVSGIDQALWDLKGRCLDRPVHELLGGPTRSSIRVYAHANVEGSTGDPEKARRHASAGFDLLKVAPQGQLAFLEKPGDMERMVDDLTAVREAVGSDVDIAVDLHGRCSLPQARRLLPRLDELDLAFVEEPVRPEFSDLIGDVVDIAPMPIATGERLYSRTDFRPVLDAGVAIVQPDVSHAGGITESFRIATMAEAYDAQLAPHSPLGAVALAACLQLGFALPNFYAQEQTLNLHLDTDAVGARVLADASPLVPTDGRISRLTGPGLGVEVDEDAVRAAVEDGPLEPGSPTWTYADGSFAEW